MKKKYDNIMSKGQIVDIVRKSGKNSTKGDYDGEDGKRSIKR